MKATHQQRAALTGALAMVLTWCGTAGAAMRDVELGTGTKLAFATIEKGIYGDWARPTLLAARGDGEWKAAMEELAAQGALIVAPPPSAPALDWSRQLTVLVALGNMDGYSVEITGINRNGTVLAVTPNERRPASESFTTQVITSPFAAVSIPRPPSGASVRFADERGVEAGPQQERNRNVRPRAPRPRRRRGRR